MAKAMLHAYKAKEMGFCDEVMYEDSEAEESKPDFIFSARTAEQLLMNRLLERVPKPAVERPAEPEHPPDNPKPTAVPVDNRVKATDLEKRLSLLK